MIVDGQIVVHVEVVLEKTEGKFVSHSLIGEQIAEYISGDVYVDDSVFEIRNATDVSDYVGPLITKDVKRMREEWMKKR